MFKKSLVTVAFLATALILSGCGTKKEATSPQQPAQPVQQVKKSNAPFYLDENLGYIVVNQRPSKYWEGAKDAAKAKGFLPIEKHFDTINVPNKKTEWFKDGLGAKVPSFDNHQIIEAYNSPTELLVYIRDVDVKAFSGYYDKLAAQGYSFAPDNTTWENHNMFNDKYELNMRFGQDGPDVTTIRVKLKSAAPAPAAKAPAAPAKK